MTPPAHPADPSSGSPIPPDGHNNPATPGPIPHDAAADAKSEPLRKGIFRMVFGSFLRRAFFGLVIALPIVATAGTVYLLYHFLVNQLLRPAAEAFQRILGDHSQFSQLPQWWISYAAPILGFSGVLLFLYFLGWLFRSRLHKSIDKIFLNLPVIKLIYQAFSNMLNTLEEQTRGSKFKRVVLVAFPHPGMRVPALVTKTLNDARTGERIVCVCVLTGVMPPSGFTLLIPERDVTEIDLTVNQTMQAIMTGGITLPNTIDYWGPTGPPARPAAPVPPRASAGDPS